MSGPDHNDWENDPVWDLVDEAKTSDPGPFFVRNVMREIRLSEKNPARWWQRLLGPKPLLAGALGTAVAVGLAVLVVNLDFGNSQGVAGTPVPVSDPAATPPAPALDELVEEEMLSQAAEDPSAFSDEALVAMLY